MTPKRIQRSRQHPWRAEHPDAVIVSRPTIYGNPFAPARIPGWATGGREQVVREYRRWLTHPHGTTMRNVDGVLEIVCWCRHYGVREDVLAALPKIAGRDLACWCPLDQPCHADVLLALANGGV